MYPFWFRPLVPAIIAITELRLGVKLETVIPAEFIGKFSPTPVLLLTGTLDDHAEQGEERFLVELDSAGRVWFDLVAVSRPRRWYVRLANPVARLLQRRFRLGAVAAMLRAAQAVSQGAQSR